jgi:hypothetical protein
VLVELRADLLRRFSAPAVSWGPPPIAGAYNVGARRR